MNNQKLRYMILNNTDLSSDQCNTVIEVISKGHAVVPVDWAGAEVMCALDELYAAGYKDRERGRDYDPRGTEEWQDVHDMLNAAGEEG